MLLHVERSDDVRDALLRFYERFSAGDAAGFADVIATGPGVSVIGTEPGRGFEGHVAWTDGYARLVAPLGWQLRPGDRAAGYAEGHVGFAVDTPTAVRPDGWLLPTRLTAVLHMEDADWKLVHVHFSVGVADEDAILPPGSSQ